MPLPALRGSFQRDNAATVLMATALLQPRLPLSANALRQGLQRVRLAGRFQVFPGEPTLILDVAHNGQAAESLAANLGVYPCRGRRHAVLGVLRDKEIEEILKPLLPLMDTWDLGQADDPRALPVEELRAAFGPGIAAATVAAHPDLAGGPGRGPRALRGGGLRGGASAPSPRWRPPFAFAARLSRDQASEPVIIPAPGSGGRRSGGRMAPDH